MNKEEIEEILNEFYSLSKNTVIHDIYDERIFRIIYGYFDEIRNICDKFSDKKSDKYYPIVNELAQDIFYSLFKYEIKFYEDKKIQGEYLINKRILEVMVNTEEWRKIKIVTKLNEVNSIIATAFLLKEIVNELLTKMKEDIKNIIEKRKEIAKMIRRYKKVSKEDIKNKFLELREMKINMEINVRLALKNALSNLSEIIDVINISWGNSAGVMYFSNPENKLMLANFLLSNKKFLKLMEELGRIKNLYIKSERYLKEGIAGIQKVDTTDNIARILSSEKIKLLDEELEYDFIKKFFEGNLLGYKLRKKKKQGKGKIVVALDLSGSMHKILYENISREMYGKALALAMLEKAIRDDREYTLIIFTYKVMKEYEFNCLKLPSAKDLIEIASTSYTEAGTNFEAVLRKGMDYLDEKGDLVFITDGECELSKKFLNEFLARKKKMAFRVISLHLGKNTESLKDFSDFVLSYKEFEETTEEIFKEVSR